MNEFERAIGLLRKGDMSGAKEQKTVLGFAVSDPAFPLRWDSNYLRVEREPTAEQLASELARLRLPMAVLPQEFGGQQLGRTLKKLGWLRRRFVVMNQTRDADKPGDLDRVREVGEPSLRPLRRRAILAEKWGTPEVAEQLLNAKTAIARRVRARHFAVLDDGAVVSCADLYLADRVAQIEDVVTAEAHRGRGHARAVVLRCIDEARRAGAGLVFLVTSDDDWVKGFYRRLGFDALGRFVTVVRPEAFTRPSSST
jgi:ribosomal protein S18 acetylase RimI-like enzyme